jgi:hypothetical protein
VVLVVEAVFADHIRFCGFLMMNPEYASRETGSIRPDRFQTLTLAGGRKVTVSLTDFGVGAEDGAGWDYIAGHGVFDRAKG